MDTIRLKKNKKFGYTVGLICLIFVGVGFYKTHSVNIYLLIIGIILPVLALLTPHWLTPFEVAWFKLGHVLGTINSYIILFFVYLLLFIPIGLILKILKKDPLKRVDNKLKTYWDIRENSTVTDGLKYQF